jgi:predicted transposase/invertase (TIGR01784 family)
MGFLNAILEESLDAPITLLQLDDPHLHKSYEDDKLSILDLLATLDNGTQVNIEIQLRNTHDMVKRSLYYWSKLYTSQMQEGMPYRSLRKTITIKPKYMRLFLCVESISEKKSQPKVLFSDLNHLYFNNMYWNPIHILFYHVK